MASHTWRHKAGDARSKEQRWQAVGIFGDPLAKKLVLSAGQHSRPQGTIDRRCSRQRGSRLDFSVIVVVLGRFNRTGRTDAPSSNAVGGSRELRETPNN